jgi:hypothetical protein
MGQDTTTIEITQTQKAELNKMEFGSYKAALQELIKSYNRSNLSESRVRKIAQEEIAERVVYEAQE